MDQTKAYIKELQKSYKDIEHKCDVTRQELTGKILTPEDYFKILEVYLDRPCITHITDNFKISRDRAIKLIKHGDTIYGVKFPALNEHMGKFVDYTTDVMIKKRSKTYTEAMGEWAPIIDNLKKKLLDRVSELRIDEIDVKNIDRYIEKISKIESFVYGGPTARLGVTPTIEEKVKAISDKTGVSYEYLLKRYTEISSDYKGEK